jgi:2OG-Fe(II) oxygenase superfamily
VDASDGARAGLARRPVRITFELSRLDAGTSVPAHTDATGKLLSLLLFFPQPGWREEWGGDTVLYRVRHRAWERNWYNRRVPSAELEPVFQSRFSPNRLLGFVKARNSYHGVPPLACPGDASRTSLNVNVYDATRPREPKRLRRLRARAAERPERWGHPF